MTEDRKKALSPDKQRMRASDDFMRIPVYMPEWECTLDILSLTMPEQVELEKRCSGLSKADSAIMSIIWHARKPGKKTRFFDEDDFVWLKEKPWDLMGRLVDAVSDVRDVRERKVRSAEKNSETAPSGSSS